MRGKILGSIMLALAALAAFAQVPAAAQNATAAQIAAGLQEMVGKADADGFVIQSVTAEGNMVVLLFKGPDGWRDGIDAQQVSDALIRGFCTEAPQFFDVGMSMRVDSIDREAKLTGPVVTACPKPAE
ncbi:hypothetical protein [Sphingopyxis sp. KK2]|uniref:hypothetical protein n=1 Tax=Sphingopyxis sp. KK2 TaxID=1855727 RepID=UPI0011818297|nr:hypothetical protein [Sphingopyxis sp. KK2]